MATVIINIFSLEKNSNMSSFFIIIIFQQCSNLFLTFGDKQFSRWCSCHRNFIYILGYKFKIIWKFHFIVCPFKLSSGGLYLNITIQRDHSEVCVTKSLLTITLRFKKMVKYPERQHFIHYNENMDICAAYLQNTPNKNIFHSFCVFNSRIFHNELVFILMFLTLIIVLDIFVIHNFF